MSANDKILIAAPDWAAYRYFLEEVKKMKLGIQVEIMCSDISEFGRVSIMSRLRKKMDTGREIIVTRGTVANEIRSQLPGVVVEIEVTDYDFLKMLLPYAESGEPIAIVECEGFCTKAVRVGELLGIHVKKYLVSTLDDFQRQADAAIADGYRTIIGGGWGEYHQDYIKEHGLNYIPAPCTRESARAAIQEALKIYGIRQEEKRQRELQEALNRFSLNGILAVDLDGVIVSENPAADQLLGCKSNAFIGKHWKSVLPGWSFDQTIEQKSLLLNQVAHIGSQDLVVNYVPLIVDEEVTGAIATFQKLKDVEESVSRSRSQLVKKGLTSPYSFDHIIGRSNKLRTAIQYARTFCEIDSTVLLEGETGTGKELFAGAIHNASHRSNQPFVAINCSAFPASLLESELFGYVEGAFTGARKGGKMGVFELAHKGTIFLDEIGEIGMETQTRLLRVLQEREVRRIGDDRVIPVDVRIIAATNKDLYREVQEGRFRSDLYFRLSVLNLRLPPLRERREDIPELIDVLLDQLNRELGCKITGLEPALRQTLIEYPWPGNIRELRNALESMVALTRIGQIRPEDVQGVIDELNRRVSPKDAPGRSLADWEREAIRRALELEGGNQTRAADRLGIDRSTLQRKKDKYGL